MLISSAEPDFRFATFGATDDGIQKLAYVVAWYGIVEGVGAAETARSLGDVTSLLG